MEFTTEERYRIWLYDALRGSLRTHALIESCGSAQSVFEAARAGELTLSGRRTESLEERLRRSAKAPQIDALLESYEKLHITPVTRISPGYPKLLGEIYDPPEVLFVKGTLQSAPALPLAVIGTRKCTEYGKRITQALARELAEAGACIVSGLAYGLDVIAARGALASGRPCATIAVQGCGVDIPYPLSNKADYEKIIENGAVVSELLPGTSPLPAFFPQRNRIISGLARGVVVTEAGERSGTSITVSCALEQGRDVFAVPGRIDDPQSMGANRCIRDGYAKAVLCAGDILCEYGAKPRETPRKAIDYKALSPEQAAVCYALERGERNFDELCALTELSVARLNSILTVMEFSGIIRQTSGRTFSL